MSVSNDAESESGDGLEEHDEELRRIAQRAHVDEDLVRALAGMVVDGLPDAEIYDRLRATLPSPDGQCSPLRGVPELLADVREAVSRAG